MTTAEPYIVVLAMNSGPFDEDTVSARILHRWPRLYPAVEAAVGWLKRVTVAQDVGKPARRSWLCEAPRWLSERLIGKEPFLSVHEAVESVTRTLDGLLPLEGPGVMFVFLPVCRRADEREERRRIGVFHDAVSRHCRLRNVPYAFRFDHVREAGEEPRLGPDGRHADRTARELDAKALLSLVLQAAGRGPPGDRP